MQVDDPAPQRPEAKGALSEAMQQRHVGQHEQGPAGAARPQSPFEVDVVDEQVLAHRPDLVQRLRIDQTAGGDQERGGQGRSTRRRRSPAGSERGVGEGQRGRLVADVANQRADGGDADAGRSRRCHAGPQPRD